MTSLARLKFYATQPHACSYLPDEQATTLFLDPSQPMDAQVYAELSEMGFRRSGDHLYRPHCQRCSACIPARVPASSPELSRQQKRILKRNADLQVRCVRPAFSEELYALYATYIEKRHADGDMYPPSREQFNTFLVRSSILSWCVTYRFVDSTNSGWMDDCSQSPSPMYCPMDCPPFTPSTIPKKNGAAWGATRFSGRSAKQRVSA